LEARSVWRGVEMPNEYKDIPSGLLDWLISTDERIDRVHEELEKGVGGIKKMIAALPGAEEVPVPGRVTRQVKFKETLAPLAGIEVDKRCPLEGEIISVTIHWPLNCNALVDVAVGHDGTWLCPSEPDTFLALNDATPTFPMKEPVVWDERLWAIISNGDGGNPHTITVIITIAGVEKWA